MTSQEQSSKVEPLGCVGGIGLVASLISIFVFVTGINSISDFTNLSKIILTKTNSQTSESDSKSNSDKYFAGKLLAIRDEKLVTISYGQRPKESFVVPTYNWQPHWSPSGRMATYLDPDNRTNIIEASGANIRSIYAPTAGNHKSVLRPIGWSADESSILAYSEIEYQKYRIYSIALDGRTSAISDVCNGIHFSDRGFEYTVAVSDDRFSLAFYSGTKVYVMSMVNGVCNTWFDAEKLHPVDGMRSITNIVFVPFRSELIVWAQESAYKLSAPGSSSAVMVRLPNARSSFPSVKMIASPDGRYIAWVDYSQIRVFDLITSEAFTLFDAGWNAEEKGYYRLGLGLAWVQ